MLISVESEIPVHIELGTEQAVVGRQQMQYVKIAEANDINLLISVGALAPD